MYGPSQEGTSLGDVLAAMVKPPFFPVHMADFRGELRFHDLDGSSSLTVGSIQVKVCPILHIGHTLGFRIEADGRTLVYISDHQAPVDRRTVDREVLELCEGADLLIHDAQYTDEEFVTLVRLGPFDGGLRRPGGPGVGGPAAEPVPPRPGPHRQGRSTGS